jgi:GTP-binding protein YchF
VQTAIVGLAGCGKTTILNALTHGHAQTGGSGGMALHVGVVKVPDPRLAPLAEIFRPKRVVHAALTYVDLPAVPVSGEGRPGTEALPAEHLARLREADALLHVVRAWDDPHHPHPAGSVDPWRDLEQLDLELTLADLALTDRRLERLRSTGRHGTPAEREASQRETEILERLRRNLAGGQPVRDAGLDDDETKVIRGFGLVTEKPVLVLLNVGESELARAADLVAAISARYDHRRSLVDAISARIEMELGQLEADEAAAFAAELGVPERGLERVIALTYRVLGLVSFLTGGSEEVRAWPAREGSTALEAAATVHSDMARGFIRAETVAWEDLVALGSLAEARRHGKLRSEGRTYRIRDGDFIEILFSR